jgi:DNA-binding ferritin-like protein
MRDHQQQYADSFWAWLFIGGVVHYFAGFGWIAGILYSLGLFAAVASVRSGIRKMRIEEEQKRIKNAVEALENAHQGYSKILEDNAKRMNEMAEGFADHPEIADAFRKLAAESRDEDVRGRI